MLDGPSQRAPRAWLLAPRRLHALHRPLQDAATLAFGMQLPERQGLETGAAGSLGPEHRCAGGGRGRGACSHVCACSWVCEGECAHS